MSQRPVLYTREGHIARLTLNRPGARNRINGPLAQGLAEACTQINQDDDIYVVVITGAGEAFCAGSELVPSQDQIQPAAAIAGIDRPVLAALNGEALAEGLEIALSCDIRIAADNAQFALPHVARGRLPMDGGTQRLPRIVGPGKALELLLTAETIDAREALAIGLVNEVVSIADLAARTSEIAQAIAGKGPVALRFAKEAVIKGLDLSLEQGLRLEADLYFLLQTTADRTEGIRAFLGKRPPGFQGK